MLMVGVDGRYSASGNLVKYYHMELIQEFEVYLCGLGFIKDESSEGCFYDFKTKKADYHLHLFTLLEDEVMGGIYDLKKGDILLSITVFSPPEDDDCDNIIKDISIRKLDELKFCIENTRWWRKFEHWKNLPEPHRSEFF